MLLTRAMVHAVRPASTASPCHRTMPGIWPSSLIAMSIVTTAMAAP
ncbi:MAG: hypothetical protein M5U14_00795 [Acidimicrobiia bacterium]|nr:hypothetical protein [Acidimicrobiia bacterium]